MTYRADLNPEQQIDYDAAIKTAGEHLARAEWQMLTAPIDEAVDAAWTPTGPDRTALRRRILAAREAAHRQAS